MLNVFSEVFMARLWVSNDIFKLSVESGTGGAERITLDYTWITFKCLNVTPKMFVN